MASKRQFVGTKSDVTNLFDQEIYCPDRTLFANGDTCDTYTKIICGTTDDCGQTLCGWDQVSPAPITNVYTIDPDDVITMTVTATGTMDTCLSASLTGAFSGKGTCGTTATTFWCAITGAEILTTCPSFPTTSCAVQMQLCTNKGCAMTPKWFANTKDEFLMTGKTMVPKVWPLTPVAANQYAGIWGINGTQFLVPYLRTDTGFETYCFINNYNMSETVVYVEVPTIESCYNTTDGCFAKKLPFRNLYGGPIPSNSMKRLDFTADRFRTYKYTTVSGVGSETTDQDYNLVTLGMDRKDRYSALITVCNLDQYWGFKQLIGSAAPGDYVNDFPGNQGGPYGNLTTNTSVSCVQDSGSANSRRNTPVLTPMGMGWKN